MTPIETRLEQLEAELATLRRQVTKRRRVSMGLAAVVVLGVGTAFAANGSCPNDLPFCFRADDPATASEVNHNFAQLKEWLEAKVGTRGQNFAVSTPATFANSTTFSATSTFSQGSTFNSTATFNGSTTFNSTVTVAGLTVNGTPTVDGLETECVIGTPGGNYPWCCQINVRNGATTCRVSTLNWNRTSWGSVVTGPFAATTAGSWSLRCMPGVENATFPACCRTNRINGTTQCAIAQNWSLTAWTVSGTNPY